MRIGRTLLCALALVALLATPVFAKDGDVVVKVRSRKGKPIADADLFFIVKTWPNNRYQQCAYQGKTDRKGVFRLEGKYAIGERYAVQVAVVPEGYALESFYEFVQNGKALDPVDLRLSKGHETVLRFLDEDGSPVKGVVAYPAKRIPASGGEHLLYQHGSEPTHKTSDAKGELEVTWFVKGDSATVSAQFPGAGWKNHEFEVKGRPVEIRGDAPAKEEDATADVADIPAQDLTVKGNERQRYFLIGPRKKPGKDKEKLGLVLVLPGGDGSADFHPFVKRIYKNSVPEGFLMAQLVSVKWTETQEIVWPTAKSRVKGLQFTTEEFVEAVIADVKKKHEIDARRIFTFSWSSSGPACYAISLTEKTSVRGSFITMSVFKPEYLPPLENAKGHPYFILHSPDDTRCPFRMAEKARDKLRKKGAKVEFMTYRGGHGWHGYIYEFMKKGFAWLTENAVAGKGR
ncbi:MAG: alpha/beta hydrolase [Planctomycetota bacterium]|jgi:predicted esterase